MSLKQRLFKFIFFRSVFTQLGDRTPYIGTNKAFTPYFQYKIGSYQPDYYLHFRKQPHLQVYKNEIFNKMYEYTGYDLIRYLEFHYEAFENKSDFIRFLRFEVSEGLNSNTRQTNLLKLEATRQWLIEKQEELQKQQSDLLKREIQADVQSALPDKVGSDFNIEEFTQNISAKLSSKR